MQAMKTGVRRYLLAVLFAWAMPLAAQERVSVAFPGPLNVSYLPLELAGKIGADREQGFELVLRHTTGGGVALRELETRNVDFTVAGVPAAMSARANGSDVVVVAAVNDLTLFVLMVRADLADTVRRPRDLAGRVVGVNASSLASKTTSQQLAELILRHDGLSTREVRIVAAGQSWEDQSAMILSRSADAILGDEPFASRLEAMGEVFFMVNLANPIHAAAIPGGQFLHAALHTRSDVIRDDPERVERMVAMIRHTLQWMAAHSPEEIVAALELDDADARASLIDALHRYPRLYSPDGRFSDHQIDETDRFFIAAEGDHGVRFEHMIDDRWAGRAP